MVGFTEEVPGSSRVFGTTRLKHETRLMAAIATEKILHADWGPESRASLE